MKKFLLNFLLVLLALSFSGCARKEGKPAPAVKEGRHGGILRQAISGELPTLDPARTGDTLSHFIGCQIYEGLVEYDDELNIIPALAESWKVTDDGLIWTFKLRRGVRFPDDISFPGGRGREVKAQDVKYSFERIARKATLSIGWWVFEGKIKGINEYREENGLAREEEREPNIEEVAGFRVLDDYTFQIELTRPFAPFIHLLTLSYAYVVPREAVNYYGKDFFKNPVGTGPFRLKEWKPGVKLTLMRNPNYWGKDEEGKDLPYLDGIEVKFISEALVAFLKFDKGNFDIHAAGVSVPTEIWERVFTKDKKLRPEYQNKYRLLVTPVLSTGYYGFMMTKHPLGENRLLRQAINYAIDRQLIIERVYNGRGIPAAGLLPPGMPGYNQDLVGYSYDPRKAGELLIEAGYPGGEGLPEFTLQLNSGGKQNEPMAVAIQEQLAEVGIKINLMLISWPQHIDSIDRGEVEFFRLGWVADYPDAENFLALFYSPNFSPGGSNNTRFQNERFDEIYREAITKTDLAERIKLYQEAEKIVVEEAPWLFLNHGEGYNLIYPYVKNYPHNVLARYPYKKVWLK